MKKSLRNTLSIFIFLLMSISSFAQYQKFNNGEMDVYYRIFGEGKPLLIIGGGPGDHSNRYLSLCELLSSDFQCILIDQRGTGLSMPQKLDSTTINIALTISDFEALRNHLNLSEWNVFGFSYGGFLASVYAEEHPNTIASLITLGSKGFDDSAMNHFRDNIYSRMNTTDHAKLEYWNQIADTASNPHHAITEIIRAMMPGYFYDRKNSLLVTEHMKDEDFNLELGRWIWPDATKNYAHLGSQKTKFEKEVLILHGRQDPFGETVAINLANYYPKSKLVFIEKSGHYSWLEQGDFFKKSILNFLTP